MHWSAAEFYPMRARTMQLLVVSINDAWTQPLASIPSEQLHLELLHHVDHWLFQLWSYAPSNEKS